MAFRAVPILDVDGNPTYDSFGNQLFEATLEEYEPVLEKQWRIYRFDFKPRGEETA